MYTDVALDPYNSDGHDGIVSDAGVILNDETIEYLCRQAVSQARAGADCVSPSDMMDGRVAAIREALDAEGFINVSIMGAPAPGGGGGWPWGAGQAPAHSGGGGGGGRNGVPWSSCNHLRPAATALPCPAPPAPAYRPPAPAQPTPPSTRLRSTAPSATRWRRRPSRTPRTAPSRPTRRRTSRTQPTTARCVGAVCVWLWEEDVFPVCCVCVWRRPRGAGRRLASAAHTAPASAASLPTHRRPLPPTPPPTAPQALREAILDEAEGADIMMVKPGLPYLDVVRLLRDTSPLPIAVYHVSGEYAMLKAAAERGWLNEKDAVLEVMTSFRRAGADLILTYYSIAAAKWMAGEK